MVKVENGTLSIELEPKIISINGLNKQNRVTLNVVAPMLECVVITGSGDFKAMSNLSVDNLTLQVTGSGDVDLQAVSAKSSTMQVTGGGDITCCADEKLSKSGNASGNIKNVGLAQEE